MARDMPGCSSIELNAPAKGCLKGLQQSPALHSCRTSHSSMLRHCSTGLRHVLHQA